MTGYSTQTFLHQYLQDVQRRAKKSLEKLSLIHFETHQRFFFLSAVICYMYMSLYRV